MPAERRFIVAAVLLAALLALLGGVLATRSPEFQQVRAAATRRLPGSRAARASCDLLCAAARGRDGERGYESTFAFDRAPDLRGLGGESGRAAGDVSHASPLGRQPEHALQLDTRSVELCP